MPSIEWLLIDPGHGGVDVVGGSSPQGQPLSGGRWEKVEVLRVALSLAEGLSHAGVPVQLTRRDDENLSIRSRQSAAARLGAARFLSLHVSPQEGRVAIHPAASARSRQMGETLANALDYPLLELPLAVLSPGGLAGIAACQVELPGDSLIQGEHRLRSALGHGLGARGVGPPPTLARPRPGLAAVVVGIDRYPGAPLHFAGRDAVVLGQLLERCLGLEPARQHRLLDEAATLPALHALLDRLAAQLDPPASLCLAFAGRGVAGQGDTPGGLLLADGHVFDPGAWRASHPASRVHLWVIADAGFSEEPRGPGSRSADAPSRSGTSHAGLSWVTAAPNGGEAWEHPGEGGGLFTAASARLLREPDTLLSAGGLVHAVGQVVRQRSVELGLVAGQEPWSSDPRRVLLHPTEEARPLTPLRHFVPLVAQETGMSCWAAGAAMIVGWRDLHPTTDRRVAERSARMDAFRLGLLPSDIHAIAAAWGLRAEPPRAYGVTELWEALRGHGPLWVGEADPELHVVVVAGIEGDGTPDGTNVLVVDPWPVGVGERYTLTFRELMRNYQAATTLVGFEAQILHAGGRLTPGEAPEDALAAPPVAGTPGVG